VCLGQNPGFTLRESGGDFVLVPTAAANGSRAGEIYVLNGAGARIWNDFRSPQVYEPLHAELGPTSGREAGRVARARRFIDELWAAGLLVDCGGAAAPPPTCDRPKEVAYSSFYNSRKQRAITNRDPVEGGIELTPRCNLRCVHCYNASQRRDGEMPAARIKELLLEFREAGCLWLSLTGGEPLVREDFWEIYEHAHGSGFLLTLLSNGLEFDRAAVTRLARHRPLLVELSVYGMSRHAYGAVTGNARAFDRLKQAVEMLLERDIRVKLKFVVMSLNRHELDRAIEWAEDLDVTLIYEGALHPGLRGEQDPCQLRIPADDLVAIELRDATRRKRWRDYADRAGPVHRSSLLYNCQAVRNVFFVDSAGRLCLCILCRAPSFDLAEVSLREAWNRLLPDVLERHRQRETACDSCDLLYLCSQCPAWARLESGDSEEPVGYLCEITHARARALGINADLGEA